MQRGNEHPHERSTSFSCVVAALMLCVISFRASAGTPYVVLDINSQYTAMNSNPVWLGKMGNYVYFIAHPVPTTTAGGAALFRTDGTTAGTTQIAPIGGSGIYTYRAGQLFISAGAKAYLLASTSAAGQEVWVTDGTAAGTHMVADIYPGPNGNPLLLGLIGTDLLFVENQSDTSWQIFRTDGTAANTRAISDFALQVALQDLLGVSVDLLTPDDLPQRLREQVLREAIPV